MSEPDDIHPTSEEERARAASVHSVDDESRVHTGGDETDVVQGAGGELRRPREEDIGERPDEEE